jgi:hypothetical protein
MCFDRSALVMSLIRNRNVSLHSWEMRSLSSGAFVTLGKKKLGSKIGQRTILLG